MATRYVNTASTAGGTGTTNDTAGADRAYATLAAAVAALPATLTEPYTIYCCGTTADTAAVYVNGKATDATNFLTIAAHPTDPAGRHAGVWSTSFYRLLVSNDNALAWTTKYIRIDGIQVGKNTSSAHAQACLYALSQTSGCDIRLSNLVVKQAGNATYYEPGIRVNDSDAVVKMWNVVAYGSGNMNSTSDAGILVSLGTVTAYNCTFAGGRYGASVGLGATLVANGCYFYGNGAAVLNSGTLTTTTCAASDTSLSGTDDHDSVGFSTSTFAAVTDPVDLHLAGTGSGLYGHGYDNSGATAPLNFTTDIDGNTITGRFDIGADWYYVAPTSQYARPASDVADGGWLNASSSNTDLYASIDETTYSEADYIRSGATPSNDTCTVGLSPIGTPEAGTVTLRVRAKYV